MGILETDTWLEQDHKRESTLAQTFDYWVILGIVYRQQMDDVKSPQVGSRLYNQIYWLYPPKKTQSNTANNKHQ